METLCVGGFINKLSKFYHAPPSDNLWTVSFRVHTNTLSEKYTNTITQLYENIIVCNSAYNNHIKSKWAVGFDKKVKTKTRDYMKEFAGESRMFLAQTLNFRPYSLTVNDNSFSAGQAAGGFLTFGKVMQSKTGGNECSISFLVSNWDICEIFIDPWIAAIAQFGLLEDSSVPELKADIIVEEYSASVPKSISNDEGYNYASMVHRKTYKFIKAFPINRGEMSRSYDFNQAGTFKTSTVNFKFDEYNITYHV